MSRAGCDAEEGLPAPGPAEPEALVLAEAAEQGARLFVGLAIFGGH